MNRRSFLQRSSAAALSTLLYTGNSAATTDRFFHLTAKAGKAKLVGPNEAETAVWTFNGQVPGAPIRIRHKQTLDIRVSNALTEPSSVHWHGIRLPNAMDGVAGLTQKAILPGEEFNYRFTPPDAGTYWYHSHTNAHEQIGRGLYGPLIIEEATPPTVDRDLVWMIDDWRLLNDASIREDFESGHDRSHAGRIGNVPTVNGRFKDILKVRSGERIRLRLINTSNARNFALSFGDLEPTVIAIDGQGLAPYTVQGPVIIGAAGRVDLILDMLGEPGSTTAVSDSFYRESFDLIKLVYEDKPLRRTALDSPVELPRPSIPDPDPSVTDALLITIAGGAMGGLQRAKLDGQWMSLREVARQGYVWAMNDVVGNRLDMPPLIETSAGKTLRFKLVNDTAFPHPMHLHGHHMKLLSINEKPLETPYWVDSPLLMPNQTMELAFVADNPGDWLFHCHALEHHAAGLGSVVRVT